MPMAARLLAGLSLVLLCFAAWSAPWRAVLAEPVRQHILRFPNRR